ncbi:MAG: SufD family Fe-S cluster assembly protein [Gammaproteobacteria bacterium]|nr:SufD family Fe-S cluster assembly protein [Gammaproteobacteria bacterium]
MSVTQKENSTFSATTIDNGAALSRTDIFVNLDAPYAKTSLQGIFETTNQQIADHHSIINHHAPFCESMQHYRGIANDSSTGIFNGKVIIEKNAQKSIVNQLNKNLLLSNKATINTKPELEIYADDVKASHGATVGQLDEQALFYLQSRGIETNDARQLLIDGFLYAIFSTIKNKNIAEYLRTP